MKLGKCEAWNFGSYSHLEFDFSNVGLGLVYGKTGSGKSMLADLPCWILYGITAKNGAADDVRSWQSLDQPTKGTLDVQLSGGSIQVTRIRGKAGQNDLYWIGASGEKQRGKDNVETQRLLSDLLGVDDVLYLSASYFCDFSPSGQFFVAKAKDRRELFEKITSLSLPVKLAERASEARKAAKKQLEKSELDLAKASGRLEQLKESYESACQDHDSWDERHQAQVEELTARVKPAEVAFIKDELKELDALKPQLRKAQQELSLVQQAAAARTSELTRLSKLGDKCPTCLSAQEDNMARLNRIDQLKRESSADARDIVDCQDKLDRFESTLEKEDGLKADLRKLEQAQRDLDRLEKENPFAAQVSKLYKDRDDAEELVRHLQNTDVGAAKAKIARLTRLYDLSFDLRGELLRKAVREIESSTNAYLEKYFDAEIRVGFNLEDADDLDVTIQKSGFECSFRQLSKGQRQLLKLCFSVSIMAASANAAGIHFDNLYFDEALDGLDDDLKVKAFSLFSELETNHESILMIDHAPAFQSLFSNKYHVTMDSDLSSIEHEQS